MEYKVMEEEDVEKIVPIYIDYYNKMEDGIWTKETAYKWIHQVWSMEDSYCLLLKDMVQL